MKLTVLGVNGPYPEPEGACSGYLAEAGNTRILLDCGPGVLARLLGRLPLTELTAVVLSHLHYDHVSDLLPLRYALQFSPRQTPLPVYMPREPQAVGALLREAPFEPREMLDGPLGDFNLHFLPVNHPVPTRAVSLAADGRHLVFTGDTNLCPALLPFARDCDLLLADAGLTEAEWTPEKPHLSGKKCGELARDCRAKALYLTHFNPGFSRADLLREARLAYPGALPARQGETVAL